MARIRAGTRTDTASRLIRAPPQAIYRAFLDPQALVSWLPPRGMKGALSRFEPVAGGAYRMTLTYERPDPARPGKSTQDGDVVEGRFLELVPNRRVVQAATFQSDDPAFAGEMRVNWILDEAAGGTRVTIVCEDVPQGISRQDHDAGLRSSLENLAAYVE